MTPMTPTTLTTSTTHNHHQRAADTPTSDVSLSEFDFHIEKSKELENNLEEQEMAIVLQRIYRGFSCRKMTTPMLVHAREMLLQEVAAVAAAAAANDNSGQRSESIMMMVGSEEEEEVQEEQLDPLYDTANTTGGAGAGGDIEQSH